jgi:hypothetical protein
LSIWLSLVVRVAVQTLPVAAVLEVLELEPGFQ